MTRGLAMHRAVLLSAVAVMIGVLGASGQETPPPAVSFPSEASAITVDALVLDSHGQPVRGLTRDDFTVLDDGRVQTIVGFEARDMGAAAVAPAAVATKEAVPNAAVTTNAAVSAPAGRVLVLLLDDLGISAVTMGQVLPSLESWIREQADPRDEITVMTTSGDTWWSDTVARGRSDLLAVLERVKGRRLAEPESAGALSKWEAYQIAEVQAAMEPSFRLPPNRMPRFDGNTIVDRVLQRWFDRKACECPPDPHDDCVNAVRFCLRRVETVAHETHQRWASRAQATLRTLRNLSQSLKTVTGRKAALLISEDFLPDKALSTPMQEATAALQKANVSVYFLAARGLTGSSAFSVEQDRPVRSQDIMNVGVEQTTLATAGGEELADTTGGVVITSNDLAAGLDRMALDASTYYLLGYQPQNPPDGKWHELEVKVRRPGLTVRARRRYLAERPEDVARAAEQEQRASEKKDKDKKVAKRPLTPAILTGSARGTLPVRLSSYIQDTDHSGHARLGLAVEIENSHVRVDKTGSPWHAALDLTILVAGLDRPPEVPLDERLNLSLGRNDVGNGWWLIQREAWLPPGVAQVRVLVRDVLSGAEGLVTQRLIVPDVEGPYLSTPILTDRVVPSGKSGEPPRLVPTARRHFEKGRPLFCQYEVYNFGGLALRGLPRLVASYTLQKVGGEVVSSDPPTPIETRGEHAVRRITLPTERLEPGPYLLEVRVEDQLAQRTLTTRADFVMNGPPGEQTPMPVARP